MLGSGRILKNRLGLLVSAVTCRLSGRHVVLDVAWELLLKEHRTGLRRYSGAGGSQLVRWPGHQHTSVSSLTDTFGLRNFRKPFTVTLPTNGRFRRNLTQRMCHFHCAAFGNYIVRMVVLHGITKPFNVESFDPLARELLAYASYIVLV